MILKKVLVISAIACLLAFNATTGSADDAGDCRNLSNDLSPDQVIDACNRAVRNAGADSKPVGFFVWRSIAYKAKGDLDRSLADLNQALNLGASDKGAAVIYKLRGVIFQMKGDNSRAEADFAKARESGN
jgi:tetratricopeptide (TPR) repeat protein